MGIHGIVPAIIGILLITMMSSGCINNNSANQQLLTPTPSIAAVDLYKSGFNEYINGNYSIALDYYNKSIAADSKYLQAWVEKGNVLLRLNRTSEALLAYDSALALESGLPRVWNNRGEALMTLGRYPEARDSFDKSLQLAPEYAQAKENRNLTLEKLK